MMRAVRAVPNLNFETVSKMVNFRLVLERHPPTECLAALQRPPRRRRNSAYFHRDHYDPDDNVNEQTVRTMPKRRGSFSASTSMTSFSQPTVPQPLIREHVLRALNMTQLLNLDDSDPTDSTINDTDSRGSQVI